MARKSNLAAMSVEALLKLRDDIGTTLARKADQLKKELRSLGSDYAEVARIAVYGKKRGPKAKPHGLKGRKVPPKYRSKKNPKLVWSGRGVTPVWMRQEMKGSKAKKDSFLIK